MTTIHITSTHEEAVHCGFFVQERSFTLLRVRSVRKLGVTVSPLTESETVSVMPTVTKLNYVVQRPFGKATPYPAMPHHLKHTSFAVTLFFKERPVLLIGKISWQHRLVSEVRLAVQDQAETSRVLQASA